MEKRATVLPAVSAQPVLLTSTVPWKKAKAKPARICVIFTFFAAVNVCLCCFLSRLRVFVLTAEFAINLLQPELLFPIDKVLATEDGIYLFNKAISFIKDYENQNV